MPPRLRSPNFPCAATSSPSIRSQPTAHRSRASREFSQTTCQHATLRRRRFYDWLNGHGSLLKEPLPGSTNYLGAYDRYGNLVRAPPGWTRKTQEEEVKVEEPKTDEAEAEPDKETPEGQEAVDELEMAVRREEEKNKDTRKQKDDDKLPPETAEDLRPFPLNKHFRSQPVLSEELREAIYRRVARDGASVSLASVEFGVSNERVGAVVRLKQIEKEWIAQGKKLALPYAKAVLAMVPTTPYIDPSLPSNKGKRPITHEAINDLIVHPATRQQLFVPVSESRQFTRVDAGKAFDNDLLPADDRIPHPELVQAERDIASGLSLQQRRQLAEERMEQELERKKQIELKRQEALKRVKTVSGRRWDFVFEDVSVESVGRDGRSAKGVGWRYGFPHEDRKKGQVKIPTKVEA
ncbi:eukaryotic mitochondrial regulator protein-domain-containing protein [Clohesyomyces aquaticus]|uniref:Eukaryotic mitochondrial regulator protein-domain-containing protein n=1 Tax=Clohesyomyces aquaticus TaxID=1231657 RepID=A0A1Y2A6T8_9PLEO|nr:eukaryotic mitochondrial regulator protein-domain-containing protein [Clohesyomyces aquaticus]